MKDTNALTLDCDRGHEDDGRNQQQDILDLTPRRLAEVGLAVIEQIADTVEVLSSCLSVEPVKDLIHLLRDILAGLLLEQVDNVRVEEVDLRAGLGG